ncbi:MAG: hypothetical protein LBP63_05855 [Prevotellaceae bacterium]|jgi:hypothetical protein|nr:hypothetical protein [Prevotellaceae bacterium]
MKKAILQTTAILLILAGVVACGKENENNEINTLKGTKWKLAGIVDAKTGVLKELEPKDCEQCYTLTFDTDSTAWGKSVLNTMYIRLLPKPYINIMTEIDDSDNGDVQLFYDAIKTVDTYKVGKNELQFFYNKKKNYLLYKLI